MTEHTVVFLFAVLLFVVLLLGTGTIYLRRARRVSRGDAVGELLARLVAVDRNKLAQVATDLTDLTDRATDRETELEPWHVWELTGGLAGVEALAANCDVLIGLACHLQEWYPEALPVAEQLRMNAREIQWHLERLRGAQQRGHVNADYPEYAQRAVAIYYGMTRHLLALYEAAAAPSLEQLRAVL